MSGPRLVALARTSLLAASVLGTVAGCDQVTTVQAPDDPDGHPAGEAGDVALGKAAFEQECASCHASGDGVDLAFFAFPDSTIVRRAVAHVDTATAFDITAYLSTVAVVAQDRGVRLFQPGGRVLDDDLAFAVELFGADAWPSGLTSEALRSMDPRTTPVALPFPLWSFEGDNRDWMPDTPLPESLLAYRDGFTGVLLDRYYESRSANDLRLAIAGLRASERDAASAAAPCVDEPVSRLQPVPCFNVRRWIATLGAQYMVREGIEVPVEGGIHDAWWDVGNAVRRSLNRDRFFDNGVENWAQWMYLGWAFEPHRHASIYLGNALTRLDLDRHATYHALRAMVSRPNRSSAPYEDVRNAARFAPAHWALEVVGFGYRDLLARLEQGHTPLFDDGDAADRVRESYDLVEFKAGSEATRLAEQRDRILALLGV